MLGKETEELIGQYVSKLNELLAATEEAAKQEASKNEEDVQENGEAADATDKVEEPVTE